MKTRQLILLILAGMFFIASCKKDDTPEPQPKDPDTAEEVSVDRFSADAGTLFVRDDSNGLPEANMPVNFDQGPFITQGFGPNGEVVRYYNFDVQPLTSAPIFVLFHEGESTPVQGQLNIIDVVPGDASYNDFWHVHKVTVPADYVANVVTSYQEIVNNGYAVERTNMLVNCPVVPKGSTADLRYKASESNGLVRGWYNGKIVYYFSFFEKDLTVDIPTSGHPDVPVSDILVTFNINPDQPGGGPPSGFMTEASSMQTHNVLQTLPEDSGYSPFWEVNIYDNADFDMVMNWQTATSANILVEGAALVNCPVVWKQ